MNKTYRQQQMEKAQTELNSARQQYNDAKTKKSKMQADENMSFWNAKLAFFENIKYGAFEDEKISLAKIEETARRLEERM